MIQKEGLTIIFYGGSRADFQGHKKAYPRSFRCFWCDVGLPKIYIDLLWKLAGGFNPFEKIFVRFPK